MEYINKDIEEKRERNLSNPANFFNRELSFIEFNRRVLLEATDKSNPLLERLKFCSIFSSNLDEFFMIRVAGLKGQIADNIHEDSINGMSASEQLRELHSRLLPLYRLQEDIFLNSILPELQEHGIFLRRFFELGKTSKDKLKDYFIHSVMPALTPIALSPANPFPRLISRSLNVAFVLRDTTKEYSEKQFAFIQIPTVMRRFIKMHWLEGEQFILIEQIIKEFAYMMFPGMEIEYTNTFRITRDADIELAEDEAEDLISALAGQLKTRRWGRAAVRLEHSSNMPAFLASFLRKQLNLEKEDVYVVNRPLSLPHFMELMKLHYSHLKEKPFVAGRLMDFCAPGNSVFEAIKNRDYLVHHPFESFDSSVVEFISQASKDPDVAAIKITLYRTNRHSAIVKALKRAAEADKSVVALVELKARFDEESNISWAKELERVGVHVVYGVPGLKTHCKIALVVRKEEEQLKTYMHLATGNYNQNTAKLYTDLGFFTANEEFAQDGVALFNHLTAYSHHTDWKKLIVAPDFLYDHTIALIDREAENHTSEKPGSIFVKLNSLAHEGIIKALYRASNKGVKIKLIVRGICCLIPGVPGLSENIEVRSVVGRFLEHTRIFMFENNGNEEIFLSSADWMSRNMLRRVETMFPIESPELKKQIKSIMEVYWLDNRKSWILNPDGTYTQLKPKSGGNDFIAQDYFLKHIKKD
jgi:polyphosphate kinase